MGILGASGDRAAPVYSAAGRESLDGHPVTTMFYLAVPLGENITAGASPTAPYGLGLEYRSD